MNTLVDKEDIRRSDPDYVNIPHMRRIGEEVPVDNADWTHGWAIIPPPALYKCVRLQNGYQATIQE